jgi:uracil-DNA glycosylase family 4
MSSDLPELRAELAALVRGALALGEQLADSGALWVPRGGPAAPLPRAAASPEPERSMPATSPNTSRERAAAPVAERAVPTRESRAPLPVVSAKPPAVSLSLGGEVAAQPSSIGDRLAALDALAAEVRGCVACTLCEGRKQTVFSRGEPETPLMFVGEGPGAEEDAQGLPFVGPAGQLLDKMIVAMGYRPEQVYIANIVKCRPPNNRKPQPDEVGQCVGYLHRQITLIEPKVIVALGATACEGLLGLSGITRLRGSWRLYRSRIPVMPTFHPAYLLRTPSAKREAWSDLQQVMARLREGS